MKKNLNKNSFPIIVNISKKISIKNDIICIKALCLTKFNGMDEGDLKKLHSII